MYIHSVHTLTRLRMTNASAPAYKQKGRIYNI